MLPGWLAPAPVTPLTRPPMSFGSTGPPMPGTATSVPSLGSTATASDLLPNRSSPESNQPPFSSVRLKVIGSGPTPIGC